MGRCPIPNYRLQPLRTEFSEPGGALTCERGTGCCRWAMLESHSELTDTQHTGRAWILSAVTFSQLTPSLATSTPRTHLSDSRPWTLSIRRLFPFAFSTASPSNLLSAERLLSPVVSATFGCPPSFCSVSNSPRQTGCPPATQSRKLSNPPSRKGLAWLYHHQEGIKHLSLSR